MGVELGIEVVVDAASRPVNVLLLRWLWLLRWLLLSRWLLLDPGAA
jgi:hypothetical protein